MSTDTPSTSNMRLKLISRSTHIKENILKNTFLLCAFVAVLAVALIFIFTIWKASPIFTDIGLARFFGFEWSPTERSYGIGSLIVGSALVTVGALIIGVPLAIGCAVYLTEISSKRVSAVVSTAVDLLAGIPSIIYGFFGMIIVRPLVAQCSGGLGFGAVTAWLVLAVMIIPTITTLTADALRSIPAGIREASFSVGATSWQTIYKVVLPAAKNGIVNAIVLGMGRAIGETMAVLMVVGNAPVIPDSIVSPVSTLTSQIALDMGYSSGLHRSALFGMGVVLFVVSATLVSIVRFLSRDRSYQRSYKPARGAKTVRMATPTAGAVGASAGRVPVVEGTRDQSCRVEKAAERRRRQFDHAARVRVSKGIANIAALGVFRFTALLTTVILLLIIGFVVISGAPNISFQFIFGWPEGVNAQGGIWPTIVSSLFVTVCAMLICTPIAVLAAVYLAEYARQGRLVSFVRYAADTLSSVPSIVMGLFGYAVFVEVAGMGLSILSAALALALMMLPIVMRTTEEAIRAVPRFIRWGAYGLGATKWQVVSKIVLPSAFPRIATGIVLAIGRAIGETAVVLYTMGQAINLPISPFDSGRPMTIHLYLLANDGINMNAAYGTAFLLMVMILAFNLFARHISRMSAAKAEGK